MLCPQVGDDRVQAFPNAHLPVVPAGVAALAPQGAALHPGPPVKGFARRLRPMQDGSGPAGGVGRGHCFRVGLRSSFVCSLPLGGCCFLQVVGTG